MIITLLFICWIIYCLKNGVHFKVIIRNKGNKNNESNESIGSIGSIGRTTVSDKKCNKSKTPLK